MAAGALVALGASPASAAAAPVQFIVSLGRRREEAIYSIPAVDGIQIDKSNKTIITRWEGKVYVFGQACPDRSTAIRWSEQERQFECPRHHSRFLPDGSYVKESGRATRSLDRFAVRRQGDNVVADLDRLFQEAEDAAEWMAAFVKV